jgi:cell division protein FtsB
MEWERFRLAEPLGKHPMNSGSSVRTGAIVLALCTALICYFGYFALYGRHGLVNYAKLQREKELRQVDLDLIVAERMALERRVNLLKPESIDPDLLEERARDTLGLTGPNELVLPRAPN